MEWVRHFVLLQSMGVGIQIKSVARCVPLLMCGTDMMLRNWLEG